MAISKARELLKKYSLRHTACRAFILDVFQRKGLALSVPELEDELEEFCDRVTIYRTLTTFLDKGILHKVLDDGGAMKYALCSDCTSEIHNHDHVHFKCDQCGGTTCLDHVASPNFRLPQGYALAEVNVLLTGLCPQCA